MKKLLVCLLVACLLVGAVGVFVGCGEKTYEIALITDKGDIDDKSFNQGAWEGVKAYAEEHKISHKYFKPAEAKTPAYIDAIKLAIANGAKIVVTPGFLFEEPVFSVQDLYPDVKFILLDGSPNNGKFDSTREEKIGKNTASIFYAEEQSGYLAGYAAVKDGYTKLGFMGGMAVPAVMRFGHGFVEGANDAAAELNLADKAIDVKYFYTGDFQATPEVQTKATGWYTSGTEVIFACGGAVGQSVMAAANAQTGKKVIGVDVDQKADSATVITSATKNLKQSVVLALTDAYKGETDWAKWGGKSANLNAKVNGIGLPADFSRFKTFNKTQYDAIYAKLVAGTKVVDAVLYNADKSEHFPTALKVELTVDKKA